MSFITLTACSLQGSNSPESSDTSMPTITSGTKSGVPNGQFDTGEFKATTTETHQTDRHTSRYVESFVLAEYLPLPFEIDGKLTESRGAVNVITPESLRYDLSREQIEVMGKNPPLYGFLNAAASSNDDSKAPQVAISHMVLRFNDPETALKAAQAQHELLITKGIPRSEESLPTPHNTTQIDGMPESLVSITQNGDKVVSFTPHQEYIIYTYALTSSDNSDWAFDYVKKALAAQTPLLEQFPSVKTEAGYGKTDELPSIDPGNVLTYAVPYLEDVPDTWAPGSFGPRGIASQFSEPQVMYNSLIENGIEHIGVQHSYVFHAKSESGARAFRDTFVDSNLRQGGKKYDEPQDVPDTTCTATPFASGIRYDCLVVHGNYVGYTTNSSETSQANDEETKRRVSQKTAAQYLIFKQNISLPHKR
ncbi:DUF7373 family lipoprotein [Corynebacterium canis]